MSSSSSLNNMQISNQIPVNLTGGPLSYRYRFHEIHIHYGLHDQFGSEHSVEGYTFPAEVSAVGFLTIGNLSQALSSDIN